MWILTLPWILLLLVVALIVCLCKKWRITSGVLVVCLLIANSYGEVSSCKVWNWFGSSQGKTLRVMTWNIDGSECDTLRAESIADEILEQDADVVFLAEDFEGTYFVVDSLLRKAYKYAYANWDSRGHYFYSKYPIMDSGRLPKNDDYFALVYSKILVGKDSLMIYGCHLSSNNYDKDRVYHLADNIDDYGSFKTYVHNVKMASAERCNEVDSILYAPLGVNACGSMPVIIMGDFNDVCGSKPLRKLSSSGFDDAWWERGFGYGATIHHPLPYRIDHILYREGKEQSGNEKNGLELKSIKKIDNQGLSDHDALVAEFELK